ncbi:MAG: PD40 domain-containing protein, partial [Planctomycetes bacterium]|nr:PD40 domain-containing protein [Planctomycetota bacterium]
MNRTSLLVLLALVAFLAVPAGAQTITQVTNNGSGFYDQYPAISEDGLTCAWCGKDPVTNTNQVWVADLKNLVSTMITSGAGLPIPYPIGISGDGTTVVYSSSNNIWVVPAAGGVAKQVTNYTGTKRVQTYGITVSRDGQFACYTTYNSTGPIYDIEVVDTTTGAVVNLTQHTTSDVGMGGISGDGKLVAFSANRGNVADQIWVANRDGTNIR